MEFKRCVSMLLALCMVFGLLPAAVFADGSYTVNIDCEGGGTVTADKTAADEWETVTLTIVPEEGYVLKTLAVTNDATQTAVTLIPDSDSYDSYSFDMPSANVTVSASFAYRNSNSIYTEVNSNTYGQVIVSPKNYDVMAGEMVIVTAIIPPSPATGPSRPGTRTDTAAESCLTAKTVICI